MNMALTVRERMLKTEAVVQRCSVKKVFLKISQNPQENTCARVSFLIKLKASAIEAIEGNKHFNSPGHNFITNTKFVFSKQLMNKTNIPTETIRDRLKNTEYFWVIKLKTLIPI